MTKNFKSYILSALAVAAIAFSSCSKNDTGLKVIEKGTFEVTLKGAETKTTNAGYCTEWAANDAINIFHSVAGEETPTYVKDGKFTTTDAGATVTFTGELKEELDDTKAYNWYAFYPYTSQIETPANTSKGYVVVGSKHNEVQTQTSVSGMGHIAGPNYPIAGVCSKMPGSEKPVFNMRHLTSVIAVEVKNGTSKPINVSSVTVTTDGEDIVGTYYIDFTNPYDPVFTSSGANYVSNSATVSITEAYNLSPNGTEQCFLAVKPFTLNEGDDLTITVNGTNGPCTKTITAEKNYEFQSGKIKLINFTYDIEEVTYDFEEIGDLNTLVVENGTESKSYFGKLENAVVTFAPATNTAIISDGTGSIMYYKSGHGLKQGQTFTGTLTVTAVNYNGLYSEITAMDATFTGDETTVEPKAATIYNITGEYFNYQNEYVKLTNATVTAISGKNVTVTDGTYTTIVYTNYGTPACVVGDKITAIGTVTKYKSGENPAVIELKVWKAADLIVTEHTPTEHTITITQPEAGGSITASVDDVAITTGAQVMEGKTVKVTINLTGGYEFVSWNMTGALNLSSLYSHVVTFKVGTEDVTIKANMRSSSATTTVDVLTQAWTGVTGTSYTSWSGKTATSAAVYAGQSAAGNDAIQLRTTNSNSGIITTASGGKARKVVVTWNSNTADGRTLDIYGKTSAYSAPTDLYGDNKGTKLGSIAKGSTTLDITGDYTFIGLRSNSGAMWLDKIEITWEN